MRLKTIRIIENPLVDTKLVKVFGCQILFKKRIRSGKHQSPSTHLEDKQKVKKFGNKKIPL